MKYCEYCNAVIKPNVVDPILWIGTLPFHRSAMTFEFCSEEHRSLWLTEDDSDES